MLLQILARNAISAYMRSIAKGVDEGGQQALRITTMGLRKDLRARIRAGGFKKPGLSKALSAKVQGNVGRVYSVARYPAGGGRTAPVDLIALFNEGATVRAVNGTWLAVPTGAGPRKAGRGGGRWATPKEMVAMGWKTKVIPARNHQDMVVIGIIAKATYVTHVLIKQRGLRKRYDLDAGVQIWREKFRHILGHKIENVAEGGHGD